MNPPEESSESRRIFRDEGDTSGRLFDTAQDAAEALIREQNHVALNDTERKVARAPLTGEGRWPSVLTETGSMMRRRRGSAS
jgi:hypothetical protein